jgi:hypothetical protein
MVIDLCFSLQPPEERVNYWRNLLWIYAFAASPDGYSVSMMLINDGIGTLL